MRDRLPVSERSDAELLTLGLDLAARLRHGQDRAVLRRQLKDLRVADLRELVVCLAACVDPDRPTEDGLLSWCGGAVPVDAPPVVPDRRPPACGTESAYLAHLSADEDCATCRQAMRPRWRKRRARRGLGRARYVSAGGSE